MLKLIRVLVPNCTLTWRIRNYASRQGEGTYKRNESTKSEQLSLTLVLTIISSIICFPTTIVQTAENKLTSHFFSLSRLTDGIPHSSDLPYFTPLLPFTSTNYSKSNSFSPVRFFGQKLSKSKFLPSLLFGPKYSKSKFNFTKLF